MREKLLENEEMYFENGVKSILTVGYNGPHTVHSIKKCHIKHPKCASNITPKIVMSAMAMNMIYTRLVLHLLMLCYLDSFHYKKHKGCFDILVFSRQPILGGVRGAILYYRAPSIV